MQEVNPKRAIALGLRARVPVIARIFAITLLAAGIGVVGISYFKLRSVEKFKPNSALSAGDCRNSIRNRIVAFSSGPARCETSIPGIFGLTF